MKIRLFYHSLLSDWNHGNAHFLRGMAAQLIERGHDVCVFEPRDGWSLKNLLEEHGKKPLRRFQRSYPRLRSVRYELRELDLDEVLAGAELVIVHEWNDRELVARIGEHRRGGGGYCLLFHDTHHRMVTDEASMAAYDLSGYDGVLAYGNVLRDLHLAKSRVKQAWTWHEAADTRMFWPRAARSLEGDVVWIGNWGDNERSEEIREFLIEPVKALGLKARVYGVRYPQEAIRALADAGIEYAGWLPNFEAPEVFARFRLTVHIPRRPYVEALPGIPTIRVFEALACGIPLICSAWPDVEGLFSPGKDFAMARTGEEMRMVLESLLRDEGRLRELADHGLRTIRARHTCVHRADELLGIYSEWKASR